MSENFEGWTEADSERFLLFNDVVTPSRGEQYRLLADLIPADVDEPFRIVELGCGGGELAESLLRRFPQARYVGLDGSETMLRATADRLRVDADRISLRPFRLEDEATLSAALEQPIRCVVSSLVIHHLVDDDKRLLYQALHRRLEPGGALLVIDLVQPTGPRGVRALRQNWDEITRAQSLALTGSEAPFVYFAGNGWNHYAQPDPMDPPAPLFRQLKWLEEIGFRDVDCFWQRAGHAIFGGYT